MQWQVENIQTVGPKNKIPNMYWPVCVAAKLDFQILKVAEATQRKVFVHTFELWLLNGEADGTLKNRKIRLETIL